MNNEPVTGDLKTENGFDWVFDGSNWLKIMNNEPVAWMARNELLFSVVKDEIHYIPLYTHPVKELTTEEIFKTALEQYGHSVGLYGNHIGFARAILRKAQEK
jgi:hypothetical protein